jgi:hypothetical protein
VAGDRGSIYTVWPARQSIDPVNRRVLSSRPGAPTDQVLRPCLISLGKSLVSAAGDEGPRYTAQDTRSDCSLPSGTLTRFLGLRGGPMGVGEYQVTLLTLNSYDS